MDPRLDLEPLDPARDAERWEALVGRILVDAAPALQRRAAPPGPMLALAELLRPAAGVAFACALASVAVLVQAADVRPGLLSGIPEELGLPVTVAEWLAEERAPTADDLLASLDREIP